MKKNSFSKIGNGPNLVFLHGWKQDRHTWDKIAEFLKVDFTCWLVDLPYFGKNDETLVDFSPGDYAKWLDQFLKENKIGKTHILGYSFGGRIAVVFAGRTNKVDKLILYAVPLFKLGKKARFVGTASKILKIKNIPVLSDVFRSNDYKDTAGVDREIFLKNIGFDYSKLLNGISCPTLIIWGENDSETPLSWARELKDSMKNSRLYIISKAGHFAHIEKPLLFASKIKEFLI